MADKNILVDELETQKKIESLRRRQEDQSANSQPITKDSYRKSPTDEPKFGFESYLSQQDKLSGGRKLNKTGSKYITGPFAGMTAGQAEERARKEYAAMKDEDRINYETRAYAGDVTSAREAQDYRAYADARSGVMSRRSYADAGQIAPPKGNENFGKSQAEMNLDTQRMLADQSRKNREQIEATGKALPVDAGRYAIKNPQTVPSDNMAIKQAGAESKLLAQQQKDSLGNQSANTQLATVRNVLSQPIIPTETPKTETQIASTTTGKPTAITQDAYSGEGVGSLEQYKMGSAPKMFPDEKSRLQQEQAQFDPNKTTPHPTETKEEQKNRLQQEQIAFNSGTQNKSQVAITPDTYSDGTGKLAISDSTQKMLDKKLEEEEKAKRLANQNRMAGE